MEARSLEKEKSCRTPPQKSPPCMEKKDEEPPQKVEKLQKVWSHEEKSY